jgi:excisionase family DNA binding protein
MAYSTVELSRLLPFTQKTWERWARAGVVRAISFGHRTLVPRSEVDRILREEVREEQPELAAQL